MKNIQKQPTTLVQLEKAGRASKSKRPPVKARK
jgi:hypothetical protein